MRWGILLIVIGIVAIITGLLLLKARIKTDKDEDPVAFALDVAYSLPEPFCLTVAGLVLLIVGIIVSIVT